MTRERLPNRRRALAVSFEHGGIRYRAHIGYFANGAPAELFVDAVVRPDSAVSNFTADASILISLLLQRGSSVTEISHGLRRNPDGSPASVIGQAIDTMLAEQERER
jgi:hypothetical protein